MKKVIIMAIVGLLLAGYSVSAYAVPLAPGGNILPGALGAASPGVGVPLATISTPWATASASGMFYQWVRSSGTGLVFEYQFTVTTGAVPVTQLGVNFFDNFYTSVDAFPSQLDPQVNGISRSPATGTAITFAYFDDPVNNGQTSQLLWVQTNAQYMGSGEAGIIAGTTRNLTTYGPATPEPTSVMLLGMGLVGLFGAARKKLFKA